MIKQIIRIFKEQFNRKNASKTLKISVKQKEKLEKLAKGRCVSLHLKQRAKIILELTRTANMSSVADTVNVSRSTVAIWKERWLEMQAELKRIEKSEPWNLKSSIIALLNDAYRSGRKSTFNMVQIAHIIFLSLQTPQSLDVPMSHWTPSALAEKAKELKIVDKISARQVGRYLEQMDIKVHQYKGWLNSKDKIKDPEEFERRTKKVCETYKMSRELEEQGILVMSTDEKTGIQALEHKYPAKAVKPSEVEKCEQEYIRHGTTTLIASRNVATGKVVGPMLNDTRTEKDFVQHISDVVGFSPDDRYVFVMDQLNTHQSEGLVRYIASECGIEDDLGEKDKSGILKNMKSRQEFLENEEHRICIVYTPKHCSWLNQVEMWFSILGRMLLNKRASFKSVEALKDKIKEFIEYYNNHLAKAFKWTYSGKLLQQ
jgi:transposase